MEKKWRRTVIIGGSALASTIDIQLMVIGIGVYARDAIPTHQDMEKTIERHKVHGNGEDR
jgi:hypothetical protein